MNEKFEGEIILVKNVWEPLWFHLVMSFMSSLLFFSLKSLCYNIAILNLEDYKFK